MADQEETLGLAESHAAQTKYQHYQVGLDRESEPRNRSRQSMEGEIREAGFNSKERWRNFLNDPRPPQGERA